MREKQEQKQLDEVARCYEAEQILEYDKGVRRYMNAVDHIRFDQKKAVQTQNLISAQDAKNRRGVERQLEAAVEKELVERALNDPFLSEATEQKHAACPYRVRPDHFKGMTNAELEKIRLENENVRKEKEMCKLREVFDEEAWAQKQESLRCSFEEMEIVSEERRNELMRSLREEWETQSTEHRLKHQLMEEDRKRDSGEAFFRKFGTSFR